MDNDTSNTTPNTESADGERLEIILVEDNRLNLELARTVLELKGHRVVALTSGAEFLAYLGETKIPSIVVLDIMLPDGSGIDLLAEMRRRPHMDGIKAIAVTAHALVGEAERLAKLGFDGVLTKPIDTRRFALDVARIAKRSTSAESEKSLP